MERRKEVVTERKGEKICSSPRRFQQGKEGGLKRSEYCRELHGVACKRRRGKGEVRPMTAYQQKRNRRVKEGHLKVGESGS